MYYIQEKHIKPKLVSINKFRKPFFFSEMITQSLISGHLTPIYCPVMPHVQKIACLSIKVHMKHESSFILYCTRNLVKTKPPKKYSEKFRVKVQCFACIAVVISFVVSA